MKLSEAALVLMRSRSSAWVLGLAAITACTTESGKVPVSLHGVNYTKEEFNYWVQDPLDPKNKGGGEMVDSFSGGGTMCCYELPRQWRPGLQVLIEVTRTLPKTPTSENSSDWEDIVDRHIAEVPPYVDGKPGELWVVRHADGSFGVVSSDYQPDHEKWPGPQKGWPVPSLEYQRERWDLYIKLAQDEVDRDEAELKRLQSSPGLPAAETWRFKEKFIREWAHLNVTNRNVQWAREDQALLARFKGPTDPAFIDWLRQFRSEQLERSRNKLKRLLESRP